MAGFSLSFFCGEEGKFNPRWWDELTPEIAQRPADRARAAGCKPDPESDERCGVPVTWRGPSVGEVLFKLGKDR